MFPFVAYVMLLTVCLRAKRNTCAGPFVRIGLDWIPIKMYSALIKNGVNTVMTSLGVSRYCYRRGFTPWRGPLVASKF